MSLGESKGGLPPDSVVDTEDNILKDSLRLIERYHDSKPGSMLQVVLAPCSPFSVTGDLMKESAKLARQYGVHLHTHLSETQDEDAFCLQQFGHRPVAYMQSLDWVGQDVWFAHSVYVNAEEIQVFSKTGCGVAHCPSSNMRLASGIAPVREYLKHKVKVGLGVDGSASNDGSHLLAEVRQSMLLARVRAGLEGASLTGSGEHWIMTARQALELGTRGGAAVLGRGDIGSLEAGKCADFIAFDLKQLDYAGALHDPVSAIVFCSPQKVNYNVVHGKMIVREGHFLPFDSKQHAAKHNQAAQRLLSTV
jgi:8-oxoguanine deaminase